MAGEPCRACDGRGTRATQDKNNVLRDAKVTKCSRCQGDGCEPGPPTGEKRRFFPRQKKDETELTLEEQADKFLATRGFKRGGTR